MGPRAAGKALNLWPLATVLAVMLVAAPAVFIARSALREETVRRSILQTLDMLAEVQDVVAHVEEAQSAERAYLITLRPDFLASYRRSRDLALQAAAHQIAKGALSDPSRRRLGDLRSQIVREVSDMDAVIALRQRAGLMAAARAVGDEAGAAGADGLRQPASSLLSVASENLIQGRAEAERLRTENQAALVLILAGLLALSALAAGNRVLRVRERERLLATAGEAGARIQAILDSAMDAIVSLNASGGIETVNPAAMRLFGYTREELLRRDFSILIDTPPDRRGAFLNRLIAAGGLEHGELQHLTGQRKDGSTFPIDVALGGMRLVDGVHVVAIVRDMSEQRRMAAVKDEFISTVSHELRTPLTSIAGALGLLKGGAGGQLSERATRLVQLAEANSARLVRLINDILDIEKMESGKASFDFQPIRLGELVRSAVDGMAGLAEERGVRLAFREPDLELAALGDADRLMQVMANLLSNAVKFSPRTGEVEVGIDAVDERVRVSIRDHGPGIPEGLRARVFEKFGQADGADTRAHDGTGLGLPIAREIVRRHGGHLDFDALADGTRFWFELPLHDLEQEQESDASGERRILVCEDDLLTAEFLRDELEKRGWACDLASTANEARHAIYTGRYAVMLLDMHLPDSDGLTLLRNLRQTPNTRRLPIIVVSGASEGRAEAAELGVTDWLDKPVNLGRLVRALETAIEHPPGPAPLILHIDDDRDLLEVARSVLGGLGEVVSASSLETAREVLDRATPDLVILDLGLPDGAGSELLDELHDRRNRPIPVMVYTAQEPDPGVQERVECVLTKSRVTLPGLARRARRIIEQGGGAEPRTAVLEEVGRA